MKNVFNSIKNYLCVALVALTGTVAYGQNYVLTSTAPFTVNTNIATNYMSINSVTNSLNGVFTTNVTTNWGALLFTNVTYVAQPGATNYVGTNYTITSLQTLSGISGLTTPTNYTNLGGKAIITADIVVGCGIGCVDVVDLVATNAAGIAWTNSQTCFTNSGNNTSYVSLSTLVDTGTSVSIHTNRSTGSLLTNVLAGTTVQTF